MSAKRGTRRPVLVIHGGAGSKGVRGDAHEYLVRSLCRILDEVYPKLERGASALTAVIRATELLEDNPFFNAGKGSKIQSDGHIRMSASVMDGENLRFAGCVNVERVKNPIRLAEKLMKKEDRVLAGKGAERFAREKNLAFASPFTWMARKQYREKQEGKTGTVGAIALDCHGRLAAATSTGGRGYEYPHRVSDSPTVAGNYANGHCAISATGVGERIVELAAAARVCAWVEAGMNLQKSVARLMKQADEEDAEFGIIALDRSGNYEAKTVTETLIWAAASSRGLEFFPEN